MIGLFLIFRNRIKELIYPVLALSIMFMINMFKSGSFFYNHSYYIIPFVPVMALTAGYSISLIKRKWVFITILTIGIGESIANQQHDFFIKNSELYKLELERIADSVSSRQDLIAINGNGNPQQIYLTHRKGWTCDDNQISDSTYIRDIAKKGCKFLFVNKHTVTEKIPKPIVFNNDDYIVYEINTAANKK